MKKEIKKTKGEKRGVQTRDLKNEAAFWNRRVVDFSGSVSTGFGY